MTAFELLRRLLGTPQEGGTLQIIVGTTPTQIDGSVNNIRAATLKADSANSDVVWIGFDSSVDQSSGFPLAPGETIDIVIDNLSKVYVMSPSSAQKIYVMWVL